MCVLVCTQVRRTQTFSKLLYGAVGGDDDDDEVAASGVRAELGLNPTNVVARSSVV